MRFSSFAIASIGLTAAALCLNSVEGFSSSPVSVTAQPSRSASRLVAPLSAVAVDGSQEDASYLTKTQTATPFLTTTKRYERLADQILDVVLLDLEEIPEDELPQRMADMVGQASFTKNQAMQQKKLVQEQQVLWIEQLSKIMTASGKTLWSQARMRSGVLPSGRTVLGTIVAPLGVFVKETPRRTNVKKGTAKED